MMDGRRFIRFMAQSSMTALMIALASTAGQSVAYEVRFVVVDIANVRAAPDITAPIVDRAEWGESVALRPGDRDRSSPEGWLYVQGPGSGALGWIQRSLTSTMPPSRRREGQYSTYSYQLQRNANIYTVTWSPVIPADVVGAAGAMRAVVESIFDGTTVLDPVPRAVPGTDRRLFRLMGDDDFYYLLVVYDEHGNASEYRVWRACPAAAG
jgi:hypothetical protein